MSLFLDDGRIEIDSNVIERSIRPLALSKKNTLFTGSDGNTDHASFSSVSSFSI
ncbi:MAG: transposase [Bosea sp.]|nr:transposase [Bosea sp. (in: a-proteobacteria)]MCP4738678.1 transposase [Bosea sp. (in: a-proteobacteria)]